MAQRTDWDYWKSGLPKRSSALADLDDLAEDLGVSRAEANRFLIVAFSKSKRGEWNPLYGGFLASTAVQPQAARSAQEEEKGTSAQVRKTKGAGFAKVLDLDD